MSRHVVRYEGEGRARRPVYVDEGPAAATASGPLASIGRLSTDALIPQGGAGRVERRQANEAMRAAWRREALPGAHAVVVPGPPRMTEDELRGAYRSAEPAAIAAREEEPDVAEPDLGTPVPAPDNALLRLAWAAAEAADAVEAFDAARMRRDSSVDALRAAWDALGLVTEEPGPAATNGATATPTLVPKHKARRRPGGDVERAESIEARGQRVLEVLDRHNGNTKAAGAELGMRGNVVARIAMAARARVAKAS